MSEKNNIVDASKIHILQIKTLKGNINAPSESDPEQIAGHSFNADLRTGLNLEDNLVGLKLTTDIEALDKGDNPLNSKGSYTHEIIFRVDNLNDFIGKEGENEGRIDIGLGSTLVSIAYSTVRGIIYTRTQGTSLGTVILPVINPLDLMIENNKDLEAEKPE